MWDRMIRKKRKTQKYWEKLCDRVFYYFQKEFVQHYAGNLEQASKIQTKFREKYLLKKGFSGSDRTEKENRKHESEIDVLLYR